MGREKPGTRFTNTNLVRHDIPFIRPIALTSLTRANHSFDPSTCENNHSHHTMETGRTQSAWAFFFLLSCTLLWPQLATCHFRRPEVCHSCVPGFVREELAIGLHLGQSYGSVVQRAKYNLASTPCDTSLSCPCPNTTQGIC